MSIDSNSKEFKDWVHQVFNIPEEILSNQNLYLDTKRSKWDPNPPDVPIAYLSLLFSSTIDCLAPYTDTQKQWGLFYVIRNFPTSEELLRETPLVQEKTISSIFNLFQECFGLLCLGDPYDLSSRKPLDPVCYRFWTAFPWDPFPIVAANLPLEEKLIAVFKKLLTIENEFCKQSTLIGLGLWSPRFQPEIQKAIADFLQTKQQLGIAITAKKAAHGFYIYQHEMQEFKKQVEEAFNDTQYPGDMNINTREHCPDCEEVYQKFLGKKWQEVDLDFDRSGELSLLSPEAFHYFIPGVMLRSMQSPECELMEYTNYSLIPEATPGDHFNERIKLFSKIQRETIAKYIELCDGLEYRFDNSRYNLKESALELWRK